MKEENESRGSFEDLPFCENGTAISYTVVENVPDGYTSEISGDAEDGYLITNTQSRNNNHS